MSLAGIIDSDVTLETEVLHSPNCRRGGVGERVELREVEYGAEAVAVSMYRYFRLGIADVGSEFQVPILTFPIVMEDPVISRSFVVDYFSPASLDRLAKAVFQGADDDDGDDSPWVQEARGLPYELFDYRDTGLSRYI